MKRYTLLILIVILPLMILNCSKRENPVDPNQPAGFYYRFSVASNALSGTVLSEIPNREVLVYTPPGYDTYNSRIRYPVVYLLHGFGGDQHYYSALYGVAETLDEMINSGEIEPMMVVMPDASSQLGGGFYTNSPDTLSGYPGQSFAGNFSDFIADEVIPWTDFLYKTIPDWRYRGISGHSMGGYGALKLAMLRAELFGSASAMSAPLSFYGSYPNDTTFLGLVELMGAVFLENGLSPVNNIDTAGYHAIIPDPSGQKRVTNMMFAMAAAFSPHNPDDPDTSLAHYLDNGYQGPRVDLPFDVSGQLDSTVWSRWMANDILTLFASGYYIEFFLTDLYVDAGAMDDLGFQGQTEVLGIIASLNQVELQYEIYPGIDERMIPADHASLVGERLRNVFRFHNASFDIEVTQ